MWSPGSMSGLFPVPVIGSMPAASSKTSRRLQEFFGIYRPSRAYIDPDTGEELGFESQSIGSGYLQAREGDILTLTLKRTSQEVRKLDRVLPTPEGVVQSVFYPSTTERPMEGKILSVLRGVDKIGQFDVIAINPWPA